MPQDYQLNHELFICQCDSIEHTLIATYDEQEDLEPWVSLSVHLKQYFPWYKRIWVAIKYIFGHQSNYGAFDEFIFKKEDVNKLQKIVDYLKK